MTASAAQASRPHAALIWLIRGTGALIAIPSVIVAAFAIVMMIAGAFHHTEPQRWLMVLFVLLPLITFGALFLVGYCMWRRIDPITVANFAFIFSFLTARALYLLLPVDLPKILVNLVGTKTPFLQQGDPGWSYRATFAFLAFLIFYRITKAYLLRTFGLNVSDPPPTPPPSGPVASFINNPRII